MTRRLILFGLLAIPLLSPAAALAQRGYRGGPAMTAFGPVYNPAMSPEYRLWASNPAAYEQLMYQRQMQMAQREEQAMLKQQQAFQKWFKEQKAKKDKGQPTDPAFDRYQRMQQAASQPAPAASRRRRRPAPRAATSKAGAQPKNTTATEGK